MGYPALGFGPVDLSSANVHTIVRPKVPRRFLENRMPEGCPVCGADLALVGRVHNCRPRVTNVTNRPVTNAPEKEPVKVAGRVARWREANPEKYRAYMRDYMRRRRDAEAS